MEQGPGDYYLEIREQSPELDDFLQTTVNREEPSWAFLEPNYRAVQPAPHHSEAGFRGLLVCSLFHPCPSPGECPGSGRKVIRSQPDHS